ncbi:MAG: GNAT family N-acetyltransferase [Bacteroidota bacterium]
MNKNIQIRPWQKQDAQALASIANNRKIWNNVRDQLPNPYTVMDALQWMNHIKDQNPEQHQAILYNGLVVGNIGCKPQEDVYRKSIEIGYFVGEPYWGKGIATEAIKLFVQHLIEKFQPIRIYAEVFAHNQSSMKVLQKNGFFLESIRRNAAIKNNEIVDDYVWVKFV